MRFFEILYYVPRRLQKIFNIHTIFHMCVSEEASGLRAAKKRDGLASRSHQQIVSSKAPRTHFKHSFLFTYGVSW